MKASTIRQATEGHGWLGLFLSVPLFMIFWAGAMTLFQPEITRWATLPHFPLEESMENLSLNVLVEQGLEQVDVDSDRPLLVVLPNACLLYTSPSPRDGATSRMPSSA